MSAQKLSVPCKIVKEEKNGAAVVFHATPQNTYAQA